MVNRCFAIKIVVHLNLSQRWQQFLLTMIFCSFVVILAQRQHFVVMKFRFTVYIFQVRRMTLHRLFVCKFDWLTIESFAWSQPLTSRSYSSQYSWTLKISLWTEQWTPCQLADSVQECIGLSKGSTLLGRRFVVIVIRFWQSIQCVL